MTTLMLFFIALALWLGGASGHNHDTKLDEINATLKRIARALEKPHE